MSKASRERQARKELDRNPNHLGRYCFCVHKTMKESGKLNSLHNMFGKAQINIMDDPAIMRVTYLSSPQKVEDAKNIVHSTIVNDFGNQLQFGELNTPYWSGFFYVHPVSGTDTKMDGFPIIDIVVYMSSFTGVPCAEALEYWQAYRPILIANLNKVIAPIFAKAA